MSFEINERIKKYRQEKKMTKKAMAAALGMNNSTYCRMEAEAKRIDVETAIRIADILGVDRDLIIYGKKQKLDFSPIEPTAMIFKDRNNEENPLLSQKVSVIHRYKVGEYEFTVEEKMLVDIFRDLSEEKKQKVRDLINSIK